MAKFNSEENRRKLFSSKSSNRKKIISQSHITPQQNDPIHLIVHPANQ